MLSFRDPIHGFIRADPLEQALISSRPLQRLRYIRQLGFTYLVFPGAEHSRFSHTLGAMELAGRVYDHVAPLSGGLLPADAGCRERRLIRVTALLHDIGHAPFSHSAEGLFEGEINHEEMTGRLLSLAEVEEIFERFGHGIQPADVIRLLRGEGEDAERLLGQIISGELDVDKMDYLLRDSLYCGVRYGVFDLERLLDTIRPIQDPSSDAWGLGVAEGGVHALEALVLARYYMFTQVYFNVTGKVLELHLNEWLRESGRHWPSDPESFLEEDDVSVLSEMRRSTSAHARAITHRERFTIAFESREHLSDEERSALQSLLPQLTETFGAHRLLVSHSSKDPHRLGKKGVLVEREDGRRESMEEASHFLRHLTRIDRYRIYAAPEVRDQVAQTLEERWRAVKPRS